MLSRPFVVVAIIVLTLMTTVHLKRQRLTLRSHNTNSKQHSTNLPVKFRSSIQAIDLEDNTIEKTGQEVRPLGNCTSLQLLADKPTVNNVTLCLKRDKFFGQTSNRLLTIARGLKMSRDLHKINLGSSQRNLSYCKGAKLALMAGKWLDFYPEILDPHPDIVLVKKADRRRFSCQHTMSDKLAYGHHADISQELLELMPRQELLNRAVEILQQNYGVPTPSTAKSSTQMNLIHKLKSPLPFVSVHRRWFEGGCHFLANESRTESSTTALCTITLLKEICNLSFSSLSHMAPQVFVKEQKKISKGKPSNNIILFTDGQVPLKDATFPIQYNTSLSKTPCDRDNCGKGKKRTTEKEGSGCKMMLEISMMILSEHHFGNPMSTVDLLVHEWRKLMPWMQIQGGRSGVLPQVCFD
mmetsp:Transcript_14121/g.39018  ORF Transcript_14121/g.39018 Transcript_14121/m.39018 type:complete len:411 (+) Transcript_14121:8-1240(+)